MLVTSVVLLGLLFPNGQRSFLPKEPPVVVDLRARTAFAERHLEGACHLPVAELQTRMYELPPPGEWPLALVGSREELDTADSLLRPKGWTASLCDVDDEATWRNQPQGAGPDSAPSWRPNSFLAAVLREVSPLPSCGIAVAVGCGSGRDAVHMKQHLGRDWEVLGLDNHGYAAFRCNKTRCAVIKRIAPADRLTD